MIKICFAQMQRQFDNKEIVLSGGESSYFQKQLDILSDEQRDNIKFVNDFVAKLYYEIIL